MHTICAKYNQFFIVLLHGNVHHIVALYIYIYHCIIINNNYHNDNFSDIAIVCVTNNKKIVRL